MVRQLVFAILILLGLVLLLRRDLAFRIAGYKPLATIGAEQIDQPRSPDERDAPRFFAERNTIEVEVPREMTVDEFLRLYQLELPHVRAEMAAQDGKDSLADGDRLQPGRRYRLSLTPPERGVP